MNMLAEHFFIKVNKEYTESNLILLQLHITCKKSNILHLKVVYYVTKLQSN